VRDARQIDRVVATQDRPPEAVDHSHHRVEAVEELPLRRHDLGGKADRRDVEADLDDERDDEAKVAISHDHRGSPHGRTDGDHHGQHDEHRQQQDVPVGYHTIPDHHAGQDDEAHPEIDQAHDHRSERNDEPWEVYLADELGIAHHAVRRITQDRRGKHPRQQASEHQHRIGCGPLAGQFGDLAEYDGENDHGQEGPHEGPGQADHRLLVTHRDIAPGENEEQLLVTKQVSPISSVGTPGLEDERFVGSITHGRSLLKSCSGGLQGWAR
jgi:hypothetical protein